MKNYYSTVDNIVATFSNIEEKNGFSQEELMEIEKYIRNNAALIWEIAREKAGVNIA